MPIVDLVSDDVSSTIGMRVSTVEDVHLERRSSWSQGRAEVCQHALSASNRPITSPCFTFETSPTIFVNCSIHAHAKPPYALVTAQTMHTWSDSIVYLE